jgi:16S rRNA (uracil1498-N3)-methyltransferase
MRHVSRFYVCNNSAHEGDLVPISNTQMHHAVNVLRKKTGDIVRVFNHNIGEWNCEIFDIKKCVLKCINLFRKYSGAENESVLAFSLINQNRMAILLEKATELGVSKIIPIISSYTQVKKFSIDRAMQIVIGASEQSGRMDIPEISNVIELKEFIKNHGEDGTIIVGDESITENQNNICDFLDKKYVFLIGPEGGFSESEKELFNEYGFIKKISLGPTILRSETAAIAFMVLSTQSRMAKAKNL